MSFQLGGAVGARPPLAASVAQLLQPAGTRGTNPEEYDQALATYKPTQKTYPIVDAASAAVRSQLDRNAVTLRRDFESLSAKLSALQTEYKDVNEYDSTTHKTREAQYDLLMAKHTDLPPDERERKPKPTHTVGSQLSRCDTSSKFRDVSGKLTCLITEQCKSRAPDWLNTLTDTACAVIEGWNATCQVDLTSKVATNDVQRSHTELAVAVHKHVKTYSKDTWKPEVTLARGETLAQNVQCNFDWNDMFATETESPLTTDALALSCAEVVAAHPIRWEVPLTPS